MRIPHCLVLAFASAPTLVTSKDTTFVEYHALNIAESKHPEILDLAEKYAAPGPQCDTWVGIEKIIMVEFTEVSPDGSTVTETLTDCVETLTRSICATATTNRPCYPCVMSSPPSSDTALTVTVTSCSAATEETLTVTIQLCSTCTASIYTGTVPGYTPGGPCHGCTPYGSSSLPSPSPSPCSETDSAVAETTTTTTSTSTSTVTGSDCDELTDTSTSTPPGNPGLPSSTAATTTLGTGTGTTAATHTPTKPTTAAPPVVTAGGVRNEIVDVAVLVIGWVVVGVGLGM